MFDSVETLFARNAATALLCLLKAIGNREHIYVINMAQDYTAMKAQEKAKKEQEGEAPYPSGPSLQQSLKPFAMLPLHGDPLGEDTILSAIAPVPTSTLGGAWQMQVTC